MNSHNRPESDPPRGSLRRIWKQVWHFLWEEDSLLSWTVNILIAFLLIKFVVYPGIGLISGTSLPVVAVVSGSMEHDLPFDNWWLIQKNIYANFGINDTQFKSFPLANGFKRGDIIVLVGSKPENINVGDVIVYQSGKPYPIIHRVIEKDPLLRNFQTKGDHNLGQIADSQLNEQHVSYDQLIGKAVFKIPYLGYVKILFVNMINWFVSILNMIGIPAHMVQG